MVEGASIIIVFVLFSGYGCSLTFQYSLRGNNTIIAGLSGDYFELDDLESIADNEEVSSLHWAIGVLEVGNQESVFQIPLNPIVSVGQGCHLNLSEEGHLSSSSNLHIIAEFDPQIFAHDFIHSDFAVVHVFVLEADGESLLGLIAFDEDGVPFEELELVHFFWADIDTGGLILDGFVDLHETKVTVSLLAAFSALAGSIWTNYSK